MKITKQYLKQLIAEEIQKEFLQGIGQKVDSGVGAIKGAATAAGRAVGRGARTALGSKEGEYNQIYDQIADYHQSVPQQIEDLFAQEKDPEALSKGLTNIIRQHSAVVDSLGQALQKNGFDISQLMNEGFFGNLGKRADDFAKDKLKSARQSLGGQTDAQIASGLKQLFRYDEAISQALRRLRDATEKNPSQIMAVKNHMVKYIKITIPKVLATIKTLRT